jgi:hypothetical protein
MMRRILTVAALSVLALSTSAKAQQRGASTSNSGSMGTTLELGLDGGPSFGMGGQNSETLFDMPIQQLRAGFFVAPQWSIEPAVRFTRSSNGGLSETRYAIGAGALYHFSAVRTQNQIYLRPYVNLIGARSTYQLNPTTTATTSTSFTELGGGLGVKMPWKDRLAWRLEANMSHYTKPYFGADNRLGLLVGMSYFTR